MKKKSKPTVVVESKKKKYIILLLTLMTGALSVWLLTSVSEAFSAPFHCNQTSATQEP